jgi:hypothetical protein
MQLIPSVFSFIGTGRFICKLSRKATDKFLPVGRKTLSSAPAAHRGNAGLVL